MSILGIDLGIRKIALAAIGPGPEGMDLRYAWSHQADEKLPRDRQLLELAMTAHDHAMMSEVDQVWIEDIILGNNRKYSLQLAQTLGAVLSGLARLRYAQGLDIRLVDNKTWKKHLLGNGNADKEAIKNYIVDTHPVYAVLCEDEQDRFDAACIGLYGLTITQRASDLSLTSE